VLAGGAALAALLAVASAVAAWEFYRIARSAGHTPLSDLGCAIAGLIPIGVHALYLDLFDPPGLSYFAVVLAIIMSIVMWARGASATARPLSAMTTTVFGTLYTGAMLSFGYALRYHDYAVGGVNIGGIPIASGAVLLGLPLLLTWASDIGAFCVGRTLRGPKLMPSISPGKTRSGAVGGLLASVGVTWLYVEFLLQPIAQLGFSPSGIIIVGIVVSVAAQLGDLVESMLKREAGVKDSSNLLPGHGGVLDRLDSLFFVLPTAHLLFGWLLLAAPR
jgi:phosphatidate cytidylyltransferase